MLFPGTYVNRGYVTRRLRMEKPGFFFKKETGPLRVNQIRVITFALTTLWLQLENP